MAVSVRIEDEAFSDRRYDVLACVLGLPDADCARGKMAALWRQCTQQHKHVLSAEIVRAILGASGPDALVKSNLGEPVDGGIRICGTRGRIEWLAKLRKGARKGGFAKSAKGHKPTSALGTARAGVDHEIFPGPSCPPAPAPAPSPSPSPVPTEDPEKNSATPTAGGLLLVQESQGRKRKPKPSEPTATERALADRVLEKLSAQNGVRYSGGAEHVRLIVNHLRAGVSDIDLRAVIGYCAIELKWKDKPEMVAYLRPETLFGPKTLTKYLDPARTWFSKLGDDS